MSGFLIVGDLHSVAPAYDAAVQYAAGYDLRLVFLGDIFDYRGKYTARDCDSAHIFRYFRTRRHLLLRSNHQERMRKYCAGNKAAAARSESTQFTVNELDAAFGAGMWESDMLSIIERSTFTLRLENKFCCAHAFYPEKALTNPALNRANKQLAVYGERSADAVPPWWLVPTKDLPGDYVRVSGHYHQIHADRKSLVLDGGCGGLFGRLFGFRTDTCELVKLWEE